jgi:broad specificity phosphatase PhoE
LTRAEAAERFPEHFARWQAGEEGWPDGETYDEMSGRVVGTALELAARNERGRILVVSHAGAIRALHAAALGVDVSAYRRLRPVEPNAKLSAVCVEAGRLTELCPAGRLDELLERDQRARAAAAVEPPSPAA